MKLLLHRIIEVYRRHDNSWLTGGEISAHLRTMGHYDSEISIKRVLNSHIDYKGLGEKSNIFKFKKVKNLKGNWYHQFKMRNDPNKTVETQSIF